MKRVPPSCAARSEPNLSARLPLVCVLPATIAPGSGTDGSVPRARAVMPVKTMPASNPLVLAVPNAAPVAGLICSDANTASACASAAACAVAAVKLMPASGALALPFTTDALEAEPVGAVRSMPSNAPLAAADPLAALVGAVKVAVASVPVAVALTVPAALPVGAVSVAVASAPLAVAVPVAVPVAAVCVTATKAPVAPAPPAAVAFAADSETLARAPVASALTGVTPDASPVGAARANALTDPFASAVPVALAVGASCVMALTDPDALAPPVAAVSGAVRLLDDKLPVPVASTDVKGLMAMVVAVQLSVAPVVPPAVIPAGSYAPDVHPV